MGRKLETKRGKMMEYLSDLTFVILFCLVVVLIDSIVALCVKDDE